MPQSYIPVHFSGARPLRAELEKARRANHDAEMRHLMHAEEQKLAMHQKLQEAMEQLRERPGGKEIPEELMGLFEVIFSAVGGIGSAPYYPPRMPEVTYADQMREFVRGRAYAIPGLYIDRGHQHGAIEFYDFAPLLEHADRVWYFPEGLDEDDDAYDEDDDPPAIEVWKGDSVEYVHGAPATALLRFLHYQGVFLIEEARKPCPDCAEGPPRACDTCGSLGWIIDEPEPTPAKNPVIEGWADRVPMSGPLFSMQLQSVSVLQAIRKWCDRSDGTPAEQALMEIDRLVSAFMPAETRSDPQFSGLAKCKCGFEGRIESQEFVDHIGKCPSMENTPLPASDPEPE